MMLKRAVQPWGAVRVWLPDELETDILGGTLTHAQAAYGLYGDFDTHSRRQGLGWLVRPETELLYPRENGSTGSFYPDVIVALDVEIPPTEPYRVVRVGKAPELIVEILSPHTDDNDTKESGGKIDAYAQLGVFEYVIFDPRPNQHFRLDGRRLIELGRYERIPPAPEGGLWLESVGLRIVAEPGDERLSRGPRLRLYTASGERLLHLEEEAEEMQTERHARLQAELARLYAERELRQAEEDRTIAEDARIAADAARIQAEQDRVAADAARVQAEQERAQAERDRARAEDAHRTEHEARQKLEQELRAAREELARLRTRLDDGEPNQGTST